MIQGSIKMFYADRGYGFIGRDDKEPDVFFHIKELQRAGLGRVDVGQRVSFDIETQRDGRVRAVGVRAARS